MTSESGFVYTQLSDSSTGLYNDTSAKAPVATVGDVFVYIPKFWTKFVSYEDNVFNYKLAYSGSTLGDEWVEWGDTFIGAFKGCVKDSLLRSRSGDTRSSGLTQSNAKTYARNKGNGYSLITWKQHCLINMLLYFYSGTTSNADILRRNAASSTNFNTNGKTYNMTDTYPVMSISDNYVNFWGIEDVFGYPSEWIDDVEGDGDVFNILDYSGNTVRTLPNNNVLNDYATKFMFGNNFDLYPLEASGGTSSTYFCNKVCISGTTNVFKRAYHSTKGNYETNISYGLSALFANNTNTWSSFSTGARLAYNGPHTYVDSATFETLTEVPSITG
jgi:hypothetical protein